MGKMTASPSPRPSSAPPLPGGWLLAALAGWLGLTQLLLWRFLDAFSFPAYVIGGVLLGLLCTMLVRTTRGFAGPTRGTLLACIGAAAILLVLGGEGRFFYANIDWQVRLAVLRDMSVNPWPFVYTARGEPDLLRAPIGMFLMPALAAKALGSRAADIALLVQNSLLIGTMLALGSTLFDTRRARMIALVTVVAFSGLDALGRLIFRGGLSDHIENWAYLQFSSTITQLFWVPQHALAGWIGALGFMLWRGGKLRLGPALALLPLTALWSPLGLMGAMPFAALAGIVTVMDGKLRRDTVLLPALATMVAIPALLYLGAANDAVGARSQAIVPIQWAIFELLEIFVYLIPLALMLRHDRMSLATIALCGLWLLAIPFVQIGSSTDFMMRGSITALTIVALLVAQSLCRDKGMIRLWLIVMLAIGGVTGLLEIARAFRHPAAPQVRCSFFMAWDQSFGFQPKNTYLAPISRVPALIRPSAPTHVSAAEPAQCWDGHWYHPNEKGS